MTVTVNVAVSAGTTKAHVRVRRSSNGAGHTAGAETVVVAAGANQNIVIGPEDYIEDVREIVKGGL